MNEVKIEDLKEVETYSEMKELVDNSETKFEDNYTKEVAEFIADKVEENEIDPNQNIDWSEQVEVSRENQFSEFEFEGGSGGDAGTTYSLESALDPETSWDSSWDNEQVEEISKENLINEVKEELEKNLGAELSEDIKENIGEYIENNLGNFDLEHTDNEYYPNAEAEYISSEGLDIEEVAEKVAEDISEDIRFVENLENSQDLEAFSNSENEEVRNVVAVEQAYNSEQTNSQEFSL